MDKEFYDKYGKELDCKSCIGLQECSTNSNIAIFHFVIKVIEDLQKIR